MSEQREVVMAEQQGNKADKPASTTVMCFIRLAKWT
jgi:hypothetical protein